MAVSKIDYLSTEYVELLNKRSYGKTIYLLGTSDIGPTNSPININNESQLSIIFGTKGSLMQGYKEVRAGNPDANIFLCKTTGTHSILHLDVNVANGNIIKDGLIFKAKFSSQIYNQIKVNIDEYSIKFTFPKELGGGIKEYKYNDYEILGLLVRQINNDTFNGDNYVYGQCIADQFTKTYGSLDVVNHSELYMYGGDNGLLYCKNMYYYCLANTYELLEGEDIDIIVPLEAFIDDVFIPVDTYGSIPYGQGMYRNDKDFLNIKDSNGKQVNYYEQLLLFCVRQMRFGTMTHGVMGFNRTVDKSLYHDKDGYLIDIIKPGIESNKVSPELLQYKFLISIVGGDLSFDNTSNNGYTFYSGLISGISILTSTTNKAFSEYVELFNEFDNLDMNYLSELGVVSFRKSPLNDLVVVSNGVTSSLSDSDMKYLCNVRMVQLTMAYIKDQFEGYIGEDICYLIDSGIAKYNLNSLLLFLRTYKIITEFNAQIVNDNEAGIITYYVDLKTAYMVESIKMTGGVSYNVR